jgi:chromosome segregation ATPase
VVLNIQIEELEAANQRLLKDKEQRAFQFEAQESALRKIRQERDELKTEERALRADLSQVADKLEASERRAEQLQRVRFWQEHDLVIFKQEDDSKIFGI